MHTYMHTRCTFDVAKFPLIFRKIGRNLGKVFRNNNMVIPISFQCLEEKNKSL